MSTDNAACFYWAKIERAITTFEAGNYDKAQDLCCELGNEFRCPRFCQVEVWMLHSRCFTDNYWLAKSSLNQALKICVSCESQSNATERDLKALADRKASVEKMLESRLEEYRQYWKAKGREPPTNDEWYEIMEGEAGDSGDEWLEVAEDEEGNPLSGPVETWPFKGPGECSGCHRRTALYLTMRLDSAELLPCREDLPSRGKGICSTGTAKGRETVAPGRRGERP
jgi:hypothetical protein